MLTIRSIRLATRSGSAASAQAWRATRCPPAEWPASTIGPCTAAAIWITASVAARVIAAMRASGARV